MSPGNLVKILSGFHEQSIVDLEGLIVKGPYEYTMKFTDNIAQLGIVYDVLIRGKVYKHIPTRFLCKI